MRNFNLGVLALSIILGAATFFSNALTPALISSVAAIPLYLLGNKMARDKGLDSNNPDVTPTDPLVRIRNFGMSALPFITVIIVGSNT